MPVVSCRHPGLAIGDEVTVAAWERIGPDEIARALVALRAPWWIAGGWALDLFLGRQTREHEDIDVALLRRDQLALRAHLRDWDLRVATPEGELEPWDGHPLELPLHGIWARRAPADDAAWTCEFLLQEERDHCWAFRRNLAVTRPLDAIWQQRGEVRFLRPGVVLLFKAKQPTPKDEQDFETVLPSLPASERQWLIAALDLAHPQHPWRRRLERG
jgi:hypothetical protein